MATTGIVENYPGFEEGIDGFDLGEKMQQQAERFGAKTAYAGVEGADLTAQPKLLHTDEGDMEAKTVIIATGAYPRELGLPNESSLRGRGVAYCAACDGMMYKGKDVIIVGGGNSAIADALYLEKICKSVTLIHRREELRASKVYAGQLENSTIRFVWNSRVKEILADNKVSGAVIENLKTKAEADISEYITKKIIELKKKTGKEVTSIQFTAREKMTGLESYDVKINLI